MAQIKYIYLVATGEFLEGGYSEPDINIPDPGNPPDGTMPDPTKGIVVLDRHPDLRLEKWDGAKISLKVQAELDAWDDQEGEMQFENLLDTNPFLAALVEELGVNLTSLKTKFKVKAKAK